MINRPKRRKHKDNPYVLQVVINDKYYVTFKDSHNLYQTINVTKEVFELLDTFELADLKELNEYDRHIEHNEIYENKLSQRSLFVPESVEETIQKKIEKEILYSAIEELPVIQRRRLKMYYFCDMTLREIALIEGCNYIAVKFSIDCALNNLRKKLEKYNF